MHCARYTVASRDIPACQLILREAPVVHGPYTKTTPVCLSCYAKVRELIGVVYNLRYSGMGCFPIWFQYRKGVCLWGTQKVIKQLNVSFIICSHIGVLNIIFSSPMQNIFGLVWIHKSYRMQNVSKALCVGFLMLQAALRAVRQALFMGSGRGPLVTVRQLDAGKYPNSIFFNKRICWDTAQF